MMGGRGGGRRQERQALMAAFAVALLMGTAVYFRIWARQSDDPSFTADDREELRIRKACGKGGSRVEFGVPSSSCRAVSNEQISVALPILPLHLRLGRIHGSVRTCVAVVWKELHPHPPRRQFEHANLEAMDESAEWRMKYDTEFGRNRQLEEELLKAKTTLAASAKGLELLQKDNEMLKRQIESMKLQCNCTVPAKIAQE